MKHVVGLEITNTKIPVVEIIKEETYLKSGLAFLSLVGILYLLAGLILF